MYFPFIRGKQFDLLALVESAEMIAKSGKVIPIIEPVKSINNTTRGISKYIEANMPFIIITNPTEGEFSDTTLIKKNIIEEVIDEYDNYYVAYIITSKTTLKDVTDFLEEYSNNQVCFIHFYQFQNTTNLISKFQEYSNISFQIFYGNKISETYISNFEIDNKVILKDEFRRATRNADYEENEFYSDLYKNYKDKGFIGFGDFSIIGDFFSDSTGGAAHAVTIHYSYLNKQDNNIWIRHFISDRTEGPEDPAGKFLEALDKCVDFINQDDPQCGKCKGCQDFISYHGSQHYPGLGTVKKVSLKHHIKLLSKLI